MEENLFNYFYRKLLEAEIVHNIKSSNVFGKDGWYIKFSEVHGHILLLVLSKHTRQTIVRYFTNEALASSFISKILVSDSKQEYAEK